MRIALQVIELPLGAVQILDEHERLGGTRCTAPSRRGARGQSPGQGSGVKRLDRQQGGPVHRQAGYGPGQVGDRRREVDIRDQRRARLARRKPRSSDDQWHAYGLLVGEVLADERVLAQQEAVVGREEHDRVGEPVRRAEGVDQAPDHPVHGEQALESPAVIGGERRRFDRLARLGDPVAHDRGLVTDVGLVIRRRPRDRPGRNVPRSRGAGRGSRAIFARVSNGPSWCGASGATTAKKGRSEGRVRGSDGLARQNVGLVVGGSPSVVIEVSVLVQDIAIHLKRRLPDQRMPLIPARWQLPPGARVHGVAIAVQVLAEVRGLITGGLQPYRERVGAIERRIAIRRIVREDAMVVRVLAGEERRSRRTAFRGGHEVVRERDALVDEVVLHALHHRQRGRVLVVGHHDQDVRARGAADVALPEDEHPATTITNAAARPAASRAFVPAISQAWPAWMRCR